MARTQRVGTAAERKIQTAIWQIEFGGGKKALQWALLALLAVLLGLLYTAGEFRGLEKREAMDMAQLARNMARGEGFTTYLIRPLSLWQLKTHGAGRDPQLMQHPDIYNPPLYPLVLAGLFRLLPPGVFEYDAADRIYLPERWVILPFNQFCLLLTVLLVYLWAKQMFDRRVAVTAGLLALFSDTLWSYGISGLPTNLLMLLCLLAMYCLFRADRRLNRTEQPEAEQAQPPRLTPAVAGLVLGSAVLMGLCFLTRYLAGFIAVPMIVYTARIFRRRGGAMWAAVYAAVFLAVISPWLVRNYRVSGSVLGIARYELIDRTGAFRGEELQRTYQVDLKGAYSIRPIASKFLVGLRKHLHESFKRIGSDFLVFFFVVGLMYKFRSPDATRLRGLLLGGLAAALLAMSLIGSEPERNNPAVHGGDLLVLFLPLVAVFGVAFFYLLLDRIPFRIRLTRGLAIGAFVAVNVLPMVFTLLPPRRGLFPYPPYFPPMTRAVAEHFSKDELGASDLPWAMAWIGDRRTVWLPKTVDEFYELHDFVTPKGFAFLMLTPYILDQKPQTEVSRGEFKGWMQILRGQIPPTFPLKAMVQLQPDGDQVLFADKRRWVEQTTGAAEQPKGIEPVKPAPPEPPAQP